MRRALGARTFINEDPARRAEVQDQIFKEEDAISAYRFLTKLDKKRYGSMLDSLNSGTVPWPSTLEDAFVMAGLRQECGKTVGTPLVDYRPPAQAVAMVATACVELKRTKKGQGKNGTKTEEAAVDAKPSAEERHGGTKHARPSHGRPKCHACQSTEHRIKKCDVFQSHHCVLGNDGYLLG